MTLEAQRVALTHVNIVDVRSGAITRDRTIVIVNGRITSVDSGVTPPASNDVRDFRGRYVIPGLWDMHFHYSAEIRAELALNLANGVLGTRDMGSANTVARPRRDSVERGLIAGPRIISAGPIVENGEWLTQVRRAVKQLGDTSIESVLAERLPVVTKAEARSAVDSIVALHGDFAKVRNDPPRTATMALLHEARRAGLPVAGHWPAMISPETASDSGYHSFEHVPVDVVRQRIVPLFDAYGLQRRRGLFERMKTNGTAFTPTLVAGVGERGSRNASVRLLDDSAFLAGPRMRYVSRATIQDWRETFKLERMETVTSAPAEQLWASARRDLREMLAAGVLILAGTDVPVLTVPGFALVDEIEMFVKKIGFTPLQALQTATINPAVYFHAESEFGTVAPGKRADLVVLDGDPLSESANLRRIAAVVRAGIGYDRGALTALLRSVERPQTRTD